MQCGGGASGCKMATSDDGVLFGGVEWSSSPVTFHRNKGRNVELTKSNTVATRVRNYNYAIVFTSKPVVAGQMLKVTVTERNKQWCGGMVRDNLVCAMLDCLSQSNFHHNKFTIMHIVFHIICSLFM